MGLLDGKNILITGVTMRTSIAYAAVEIAQREGANVVVSAAGRAVAPAQRAIARLEQVPPLIEVDVTDPDHLAALPELLGQHINGGLDGIVHSIAYADPEKALGGAFLSTDWDTVANALHISAYSLQSLTMASRPVLNRGASVVGLPFDATVSWPAYDWMGVAKAALESTSRYLGPDGIRVNLVAAGPVDTVAKKAIPGASSFNDIWAERAPLSWDSSDAVPSAKAIVALLSDWFPATTGEMVHVDGGLHSTGA